MFVTAATILSMDLPPCAPTPCASSPAAPLSLFCPPLAWSSLSLGEVGETRPRTDKGALTRAEVQAEMEVDIILGELDGAFCGDEYMPGLTPVGKYHVMNTEYDGVPEGLPRYAEMLRTLSFVTDDEILSFMRGEKYVVEVKSGMITAFSACWQCGVRSDKTCCHKCFMKGKGECMSCATVHDVRRMRGDLCIMCYNAEPIYCEHCKKTLPRGHPCVPPNSMVEDRPAAVGRPRTNPARRFFVRKNGKGMIECNLGCPPRTYLTDRSWKRHVRRKHTKGYRFKCSHPGCTYAGCNDRNQFNRHLLTHDKARKYKCRFCPKDYKQSEGLSNHYTRVHPVEYAKFKKAHFRPDTRDTESLKDQWASIVLCI